ncbi:hypothetical protein FA15DRAFT_608654 [Coprinopsis marcescibilis]|uniref:MARVEL domain-containing protein n=1 Tax=Coprinopsis marcescibilis TaxID=230819 RepID=A0A5C3LAL0_COPMA|nr:hypothetical protein FA15DRAFT_608654 [Coprinopsis marcescibilis]
MLSTGFHLVRAVFFALLVLFNTLSLGFAAWHITISAQAGVPASVTSIFTVFESCVLFLCVILAFLEAIRPFTRTSLIIVECSWTALLSLFQLGAAISATINGPSTFCRPNIPDSFCASSSLLIPALWMKCLLCFGYCFTLLISVLAHRTVVPDIWGETIYTVNWFYADSTSPIQLPIGESRWEKEYSKSHSRVGSLDDLESGSLRQKHFSIDRSTDVVAPWAQEKNHKRGVDSPFSVSKPLADSPAYATKTLPLVPSSYRLSTPRTSLSPSRFVERFRESRILSRNETPSQFGKHLIKKDGGPSFPTTIADHDRPIPLPRLSEWVKADVWKS